MSDNSTSIVPKLTNYPDRMAKAQSILDWLVSVEAVEPVKTDCILSTEFGYPVGKGVDKTYVK